MLGTYVALFTAVAMDLNQQVYCSTSEEKKLKIFQLYKFL